VGLACVRGIEIEEYAAELARVTLWIGDLQWNAKNNYTGLAEPILSSLNQIERRDALLNDDGTEAQWPPADVIVGNPPFVGASRMVNALGEERVEQLREAYSGRVPGFADLVCFWVCKAWEAISDSRLVRAGYVTTNSIRGGTNRAVLEPIAEAEKIFEAWADQPWVLQGAAVRVSMFAFGDGFVGRRLEGASTARINADLTGSAADLTKSAKLLENSGRAFLGTKKGGPFEVEGDQARRWLTAPLNPNGRPNSDVLKPRITGSDIVRRPADEWVIDFGVDREEGRGRVFSRHHSITR